MFHARSTSAVISGRRERGVGGEREGEREGGGARVFEVLINSLDTAA